ncbi:MAG: hypothetical protein Q9182_006341 [Xanthomendoza sp. 2 TL-2023]
MVAPEAAELFAFITDQLEMLLKLHYPICLSGSEDVCALSLGLTFSFPVYQHGINSGILLRWTKGFDIPSIVGQDVCGLLQHQIDQRRLPVKVTALVNDAAGTVMSRAYSLPIGQTRPSIGTIFGTGTNGVYLEKLRNINKSLDGSFDVSIGEMFISIEWGSFDNGLAVLPNTIYDVEVNRASNNPGNQMFEKRVSGMFLGELLRIVLAELYADPAVRLFHSSDLSKASECANAVPLLNRWAVDSSILSTAELDDSDDLTILRQKLHHITGIASDLVGIDDARVVKVLAHAIGKRAARLGGMALGAVIMKSERLWNVEKSEETPSSPKLSLNQPSNDALAIPPLDGETTGYQTSSLSESRPCSIDVGVDGSVIEYYPRFDVYMREALRAIEGIGTEGEKRIRMGLTKDGSSVGAAIIALVAAQQARI